MPFENFFTSPYTTALREAGERVNRGESSLKYFYRLRRRITNDKDTVSKAIYNCAMGGFADDLKTLLEHWHSEPNVLSDFLKNFRGDEDGRYTPLMAASFYGRLECVKVLVAQPWIDINKGRDDVNETALYYASYMGHVDIVELLCSLPGIDVNKADIEGKTPHSIACTACRNYDDIDDPDKEEKTNKIRAILESKGAKGGSSNQTKKNISKIDNNRKKMKSMKKQTKKSRYHKRRTIKKY